MSANDIAMLSAQGCTIDDIEFPCWVSTKFDGIRGLVIGGRAMSRANIPLENQYMQSRISLYKTALEGLDGEFIVGEPDAPDCYNVTQSAICKGSGEPDFKYLVFDDLSNPELPFTERQQQLRLRSLTYDLPDFVQIVPQSLIESKLSLVVLYTLLVENGHEGVITRRGSSPYKRGRGTKRAQDMIKLKPRETSEAVITGIIELERNNNEAFKGERGQTKRSSAKAGKVGGGTLGKFLVRDVYSGVEFAIGTFKGLKAKDKQHIFDNQDDFMGKVARYTHCPVGVLDKPRQPSWDGWRTATDL